MKLLVFAAILTIATTKNAGITKNLTSIDWAHAVNNKAYLEAALASDVAMLEADIVLGSVVLSEELMPIMAHPPATTSDLSLAQFLTTIAKHNQHTVSPKGVKLDFKSIEAFEASQEEISPYSAAEVTFPLWLNADILPGPVDSTTTPVDALRFLALSSGHPRATLSIGWTTKFGDGQYTAAHVDDMLRVLDEAGVKQIVTFPVRASLAAHSEKNLLNLLQKTAHLNSTLTIWDSTNDAVDVEALRDLILNVGLDRTYLDVGPQLAAQLHLPGYDE